MEGFGVGKRVVGTVLGTIEGIDVGADVMKTAHNIDAHGLGRKVTFSNDLPVFAIK